MRDTNSMECVTERVNLLTNRGAIIQVNGRKTICMALVAYTTQTKNWHMRGTGLLINSMGMGKFIMMSQSVFRAILTIQILMKWAKSGCLMREHWSVIQRRDMAS